MCRQKRTSRTCIETLIFQQNRRPGLLSELHKPLLDGKALRLLNAGAVLRGSYRAAQRLDVSTLVGLRDRALITVKHQVVQTNWTY
jgi:hypothetical protein